MFGSKPLFKSSVTSVTWDHQLEVNEACAGHGGCTNFLAKMMTYKLRVILLVFGLLVAVTGLLLGYFDYLSETLNSHFGKLCLDFIFSEQM